MKLHLDSLVYIHIYIYINDDERIVATQKQISQQRTMIQIGLHLRCFMASLNARSARKSAVSSPGPGKGASWTTLHIEWM